jgi:hypothetical protein
MNSSRIRITMIALMLLSAAGCSRFHSPTVDVLGSYFPAWIICMIIGFALTLIARLVLAALKLDTHMRPAVIVYPCLMTLFTMAIWLAFFQN